MVQANKQKCRKHGIEKPNHFNQPLFSVSKVLGTYKYVVFFELLLRIFLSKILRRFISVNPAKHRRFSSRKPAMFISSLFPLREMRTATANLALPQASKSAFPTNKGLQAKTADLQHEACRFVASGRFVRRPTMDTEQGYTRSGWRSAVMVPFSIFSLQIRAVLRSPSPDWRSLPWYTA